MVSPSKFFWLICKSEIPIEGSKAVTIREFQMLMLLFVINFYILIRKFCLCGLFANFDELVG